MEDVEYLNSPTTSRYGDNERVYHSDYYTATYEGGFGKERLKSLELYLTHTD